MPTLSRKLRGITTTSKKSSEIIREKDSPINSRNPIVTDENGQIPHKMSNFELLIETDKSMTIDAE
jgi:hypothetical protein